MNSTIIRQGTRLQHAVLGLAATACRDCQVVHTAMGEMSHFQALPVTLNGPNMRTLEGLLQDPALAAIYRQSASHFIAAMTHKTTPRRTRSKAIHFPGPWTILSDIE
jgi:hypothetical protein